MLFVVFIVAFVAIVPFVFGLGGLDVRGAGAPAGADTTPVGADENGIVVLRTTGETAGFGTDSVGVVRVVITRTGPEPLDAETITATWVDSSGSYVLTPIEKGGSGADGAFGVEQSENRATLTFDLGADDANGVSEFGRRLEAGETVTLTLSAGDGKMTTVRLEVPESLGEDGTVSL